MTTMQRAAELQALLHGVDLPATREQLLAYAMRQEGGMRFRAELEALPDREFRTLDEVGEDVVRVQPAPTAARPVRPHEESGEPPGGEAYVEPHGDPGEVRRDWPEHNPPQKAIAEQTKTQQTQQQRQQRS